MAYRLIFVMITVFSLFSAGPLLADDIDIGGDLFANACSACHSENPIPRAMTPAQMAELPPEKIFKAQSEGLMLLQASALSESEQRDVAE